MRFIDFEHLQCVKLSWNLYSMSLVQARSYAFLLKCGYVDFIVLKKLSVDMKRKISVDLCDAHV